MTTPLRVLMISDVYFPRINGVSTSIETFRAALTAQGVEVGLIAPDYGDETETASVTRVPGWSIPFDPEDRFMRYGKLRDTVLGAAVDYDLIHIQTPFGAHYAGLNAARKLGKPVLTTYHTLFEEYLHHYIPVLPPGLLRAMARRFSRSQCDVLDAVVVPSTAMAQRLRDYGIQARLEVLPTGLPERIFQPGDGAAFRTRLGIAPETPIALFVGRVAHEKNIAFLLDMFAEARRTLPELLLLITGEGPALADLRCHAAQLGLAGEVRFLGYLDRRHELPGAYAAANAFVFASQTETQGLVLLEAMAQGCPVVGIPAMGTVDILAGERGCRIAPHDPAGFARVVVNLINDSRLRDNLAHEARAHAREWSDAAMAQRMAGLYRSLLRAY